MRVWEPERFWKRQSTVPPIARLRKSISPDLRGDLSALYEVIVPPRYPPVWLPYTPAPPQPACLVPVDYPLMKRLPTRRPSAHRGGARTMVFSTRPGRVVRRVIGKSLSGLDLSGVDLSGMDLRGWDLSFCRFHGANLSGCRLEGTSFYGADLSKAIMFGHQIDDATLASLTTPVSRPAYLPVRPPRPQPLVFVPRTRCNSPGTITAPR